MANPVVYRRRRSQGLCGYCGEVETGKKARCDACKDKDNQLKKARYEARKAAGRCPQCNEPVDGTVLCAKCRAQQTGSKSRYERNKAAGVCRACGRDSGGEALCPKHKAKAVEYHQKQYADRRAAGQCAVCEESAQPGHAFCTDCLSRKNAVARVRWSRLREAAIDAYGGPTCVGCGEDDATILELDHVDGGGNSHRREIGQSNIYLWLKQHDYPDGYRVLCPNCNKKAHKGALPLHELQQ